MPPSIADDILLTLRVRARSALRQTPEMFWQLGPDGKPEAVWILPAWQDEEESLVQKRRA